MVQCLYLSLLTESDCVNSANSEAKEMYYCAGFQKPTVWTQTVMTVCRMLMGVHKATLGSSLINMGSLQQLAPLVWFGRFFFFCYFFMPDALSYASPNRFNHTWEVSPVIFVKRLLFSLSLQSSSHFVACIILRSDGSQIWRTINGNHEKQ